MCVYIPVMPLALSVLMCYDVTSLRLVHAVRPLFRGIRCFMLPYIYMFWSYTNRCVLPRGCSIMFLQIMC